MNKKRSDTSKYTTMAAIEAQKNGMLHEWVQEFLLSEGNEGLARALRDEEATMVEIAEVPLSLLRKIDGPEEVHERQPLDKWEERVSRLEELVKNREPLPPLIVTDFWKPLEIVDGNHRHEAFLRNGITNYWAIFFLRDERHKELVRQHKLLHTS